MIYPINSDEEDIFAFTRSSAGDKIFCVFNLSDQTIDFELKGESLLGSYRNLFTGKLETFQSRVTYSLNPWEYRIYTK